MALSVAKPKPQPTLKVVPNYGMQPSGSSSSNAGQILQPAAGVKYIQNAQNVVQNPSRTPIQGGNAAAVQQAAAIAAAAVAAEIARQKEAKRLVVQNQFDTKLSSNKSAVKLRVATAQPRINLRVGRNYAPASISVHKNSVEDNEYMKVKAEAMKQAMKLVDSTRGDPTSGFWSKAVDKVTFGSDRRASGSRKWAEQQATQLADQQMKVYEKKLNAHNKLQAKLQADYEAKKLTMSADQLNALSTQYNQMLEKSIKDLNHVAAYTEGALEGYGKKSEQKLSSAPARAASFINQKVIQSNPAQKIWQYTLGSGTKNIPSIVTAPSRVINTLGNLNTKDRNIYQYGGKTTNRDGSKNNAWQSTFNQRNFNIRPVTDKPFNKGAAVKQIKSDPIWSRKFEATKDPKQRDKIARTYWDNKNRQARNQNTVQELAADPLNLLVGAGALLKAGKGGKYVGKIAEAGRGSKATSWAFKAADKTTAFKQKIGETKAVKWLAAEAKNPEQQLADAIDFARKTQSDAQKSLFPRIKQIDKKITGGAVDFSIYDDFAKLSESEAKMLQRMTAGKLSARDRLLLAGKNYAPIRVKLEGIASRWTDFSEKMLSPDNIKKTSFGRNKKLYSPSTAWTGGDLKKYNFRLRSKGKIQSAEDFSQGAVDRYISSNLGRQVKTSRNRLTAEREALLQGYDETMTSARANVEKAYQRTRSPLNKVRKAVGAPTRIWKKSVLKYRPAWTVNNIGYNEQAGVLAAGGRFIPEQAKMLNPRYARKAMDEIPDAVRTNLAKEIGGKGKLNKFYAGVENNPRVAAFRALKQKGLSDDDALKRVNKYFFDYKTKNWERPIKTVLPFWQWQKSLTKAAVTMPFDRPGAAIAYNRIDRYQQQAFDKDFDKTVPQLKKLGYTDAEIEGFRKEQAKYFAGRLKVGSKYINTPFNAFSEKGLSNMGFNPFLAAAGESAGAVDSFGRPVKGNEASFLRRLTTKFPQAELGYKGYKGWRVDKGLDKPSQKYIGKAGSEGYGMPKEKQGYDKSKPNYVASMDPRNKNKQDLAAFFGKPRDMEFDKPKFLENKKLVKVTAEYFKKSGDWKNMEYDQAEAERTALFKKFGMTADDFYKGVLAKYDSDNTKKIKGLKEEASAKNKSLFEEYAKQPKGTRNVWATQKLRELTAAGYFNDNPFLKSFKWINKDTAFKADKQSAVQYALKTGDWSGYRKLVGTSQKQADYERAKATGNWTDYTKKYGVKSAKANAYQLAQSSGDWSAYRKTYGTKSSPFKLGDKYFKSQESMDRFIEGQFWQKYIAASKTERKKLLADNPKYNRRAGWTNEMWDVANAETRNKNTSKIAGYKGGAALIAKYRAQETQTATKYKSATARGYKKKLAYR